MYFSKQLSRQEETWRASSSGINSCVKENRCVQKLVIPAPLKMKILKTLHNHINHCDFDCFRKYVVQDYWWRSAVLNVYEQACSSYRFSRTENVSKNSETMGLCLMAVFHPFSINFAGHLLLVRLERDIFSLYLNIWPGGQRASLPITICTMRSLTFLRRNCLPVCVAVDDHIRRLKVFYRK